MIAVCEVAVFQAPLHWAVAEVPAVAAVRRLFKETTRWLHKMARPVHLGDQPLSEAVVAEPEATNLFGNVDQIPED